MVPLKMTHFNSATQVGLGPPSICLWTSRRPIGHWVEPWVEPNGPSAGPVIRTKNCSPQLAWKGIYILHMDTVMSMDIVMTIGLVVQLTNVLHVSIVWRKLNNLVKQKATIMCPSSVEGKYRAMAFATSEEICLCSLLQENYFIFYFFFWSL